jgi:CheY-like chemotaxis protein
MVLDPYILVAEDEVDLRQMVSLYLSMAGFQVDPVGDGSAALERALEATPRLVVSDLRMPGMDGLQLIQAMRGNPGLAAVPVVLLTAFVLSDPRVKAAAAFPAVEVVEKGDLKLLRRTVVQILAS